ncbi:uncharacterized protein LOC126550440 isoform X2 [Aphis gossypii]|uniref:uncharacterized protein LOC126550440 isoform X2 n=2 Tax=Aphis gossypii TaxID=80765 RepID=UPI002158AB2E|nr:uncharacterized protein LOC126550440 isoform X2 [Aphis gossypii]
MYFPQPLLLICVLLILAERIHSQSLKGPGISSCSYSNFRDSVCEWPPIQVSEIPAECTSLNYLVALIDENYFIGPSTSGSDYAILDTLLASDKDVYLYYGRETTTDWANVLGNGCAEANALKEMNSLEVFFEAHKGIDGLILVGITYEPSDPEFANFTENFKIYLDVLKKKFPNLAIGLDLFASFLIDQYNDPKRVWLDFKVLDVSIDFYAVTMEEFNPCNADFKTGTVIKSAKNIIHTLDILADVLQKTNIPKAKTYFKFKTNPESPDDTLILCGMNNEKLCELPSTVTCDWCSDTIASYNEKGKFSKEYGAGFIARYIDFEDKNNTCKCEKPFFAFYALLDGFNGITSKPCELFDNRN